MTEDHWKSRKMSALLCCSFFIFFLIFQLEGCHGQDVGNVGTGAAAGGSNFFYYFSPTQRTQVNQATPMSTGNIFSSPFLNQQQHQQQIQPGLAQFNQGLQFSTPATSSLLGYSQQQQQGTPASTFFTTQQQQPLGHFQFPQFAQHQTQAQTFVQPTTSAYSTFSRLGHNLFAAQNAIAQQAYLAATAPTLSTPQQHQPQQQQQQQIASPLPGSLSFYESPFQYVQQRLLQTPPTPSIPAPAPEAPLAATTIAPPSQQDTVSQIATRRKQKVPARYRNFPIAPQLYYQFNPQYTSTIPYAEERYYSTIVPSAPTPTGYSFSLGGGGTSTSSVHVSMGLGPLNKNVQQHLTEITRRISHKTRKPVVYADQVATENIVKDPIRNAFSASSMMMMSQEAPSMEVSSELPSPSPTMLASSLVNMTSTMDTLLNEPSFQMETIAAPVEPMVSSSPPAVVINEAVVEPKAAEKISEAGIPRRLTIRKKVARKRLRLDEPEVNQGRSVDGTNVIITGERRRPAGRRRISQNRFSVNEPKKQYEGAQKGEAEASPAQNVSTTPSPPPQTPPLQPEEPVQQEIEQVAPIVAEPVPSSTTAQPIEQEQQEAELPHQDEIPELMAPSQEVPIPVQNVNEVQQPLQEVATTEASTTTTTEQTPPAPLPTTTTTTTTPSPYVAIVPQEDVRSGEISDANMKEEPKQYDDEYYEEYEDAPGIQQPNVNAIRNEQLAPALVSESISNSDVSSSAESGSSSAELPILDDVHKEDFPSVFRRPSSDSSDEAGDNSVETDQGKIITKYKSSRPAPDTRSEEVLTPMVSSTTEAVPLSSTTSPTTTTTTDSVPEVLFENQDPPEEQPPPTSDEVKEPVFEPLSTTEQPPVTITTTTVPPPLSTTASLSIPSQMGHFPLAEKNEQFDEDSLEDEHDVHLPEEPSSSTTEPPAVAVREYMDEPQVISSTQSSSIDDEISPAQPKQEIAQEQVSHPIEEIEVHDNSGDKVLEGSHESGSSSTTEETSLQMDEIKESSSTSTTEPSSSSTTPTPIEQDNVNVNEADNEEEVPSSSTTITPLPSPATTDTPQEEEGDHLPQSQENLSQEQEGHQNVSGKGDEKPTSDEIIGQAQRMALEETLKRLREQRLQQTTESVEGSVQEEDASSSQNSTLTSSESEKQPKGRLRNFVRRPLQLANLPLPTAAPVPNTNAVLDDGEGEHQSRHQVIEKIQRFRSSYRKASTTTKRPRRVTRPSSTERLPLLPDLDSFSESSSSTSGSLIERASSTISTPTRSRFRTTSTIAPIVVTTTEDNSSPSTEGPLLPQVDLSSTTEAITTVEPTTTTTTTSTPETDILTTTNYAIYRKRNRITISTTTPSTTTFMTETDFYEKDDEEQTSINRNDEDDHVYYDEGHASDSSSTETSYTERNNERYTTPSSTTTTSTTEKGPYMTTLTDILEIREPEMSTESSTFSSTTTSTEIPLATTTSAGQLIIHEILPTMPPLKEVSFVIGESIEEDQDQVIQQQSNEDNDKAVQAVVRVETKVSVGDEQAALLSSAASSSSQDYSGQLLSSEEGSNESSSLSSSTPLPIQQTGAPSSETEINGRKVRVVIRRQKLRNERRGQDNRRRRRKVLHKQLRRRS